MSNHLVAFATCAGTTEIQVFRTPVARAQYVLEQTLLSWYLQASVHNITACVADYFDKVKTLQRDLPKQLPNHPMEQLYAKYIQAILHPETVTINEMETLLTLRDDKLDWKPRLSREFFLPFLNQMGFGIPESCPDGTLKKPILLMPSLAVALVPYTGTPLTDTKCLCIKLTATDDLFSIYRFAEGSSTKMQYLGHEHGIDFLAAWIRRATFTDFSIGCLIGLLSSFAMEHGRHAMPAKTMDLYEYSVLDTCYTVIAYPRNNTVSGVQGHHAKGTAKETPRGLDTFVDLLKTLLLQYRIVNDENSYILGLFLNCAGTYDASLVSYFTVAKESISYASLASFKQSVFSTCMDDRLTVSTEASMPEVPADDDLAGADTPDTSGDQTGTASQDDDVSTGEDDVVYKRDPLRLLMELAKPDEHLSDLLYRRLVMERMTYLVKNPPKVMPTAEILLIKRWMALWVNLVSTQTIKDFLSRLSFQLMDTKQVKGTEALA